MSQNQNSLSASISGVKKTVNWLKHQQEESRKAQETAVKVEGFRLKNKMQAEIRKGNPGGRQHTPLSYIARRLSKNVLIMGGVTRRQNPNRAPLERLAHGVRYNLDNYPFEMKIGFVQPTSGPHTVSKSWRRLATAHQEGFDREITPAQRRLIVWRGGELGKAEGGDTPFFLRRNTRSFTTPARPIVQPFWQANANDAERNIRNNFRQKMKGQRI